MRPTILTLILLLSAATGAKAEDPAPLKPGPGSDATAAFCNACHTSNYIIMNSPFLTPAQWKAEVIKMRTAFGAPLDEETTASITAYLSANYAAKQ